jgi:hypothetical protein
MGAIAHQQRVSELYFLKNLANPAYFRGLQIGTAPAYVEFSKNKGDDHAE